MQRKTNIKNYKRQPPILLKKFQFLISFGLLHNSNVQSHDSFLSTLKNRGFYTHYLMLLLRNRDVVGNGELATVCQSIQFVFKEIICIGITFITVSILDVDNSKAQIEKIHNIVARRRKNVTKRCKCKAGIGS